jgi:tetratricopeptide (TPR) repeat protein
MKLKYYLYLILASITFSILSTGCATRAPAQESLLKSLSLPSSYTIPNVEFVDQANDFCGPAAVTMALRWNGIDADVERVADKVFTPGLAGSLPIDVISANRRYGMLAIPVNNLESLLTEIAANNPVIVFQNLTLSWAPQWHYALVVGYNLTEKKIILHSGHQPYMNVDISDFEYTWKLADNWGLVVLAPDKLSASATEMDHVKAAVVLEQMKKSDDAAASYQRILEKWPNNLVALIGAANGAYRNGNRREAVRLLKHAVTVHPESVAAKNNLTIAMSEKIKK